eukprot:SAG11_NODE_14524_length_609_cov_0.811765_1_plen_24_part_10
MAEPPAPSTPFLISFTASSSIPWA